MPDKQYQAHYTNLLYLINEPPDEQYNIIS
jgi:hypothetical protein